MGTRNDQLTEDEIARHRIDSKIERYLSACKARSDQSSVRVLDWRCGKGRSVAKLIEGGFDAYGVDIDETTLANGRKALRNRQIDANDRLRSIDHIDTFPSESFDLIFPNRCLNMSKTWNASWISKHES